MDDVAAVGAMNVVDDMWPARWLTESVRSFAHNVGSLLPATFAAFARVFHPAFDGSEQVRWAEVAHANNKVAHPRMQFTALTGYASRYDPAYRASRPGVFEEAPAAGTLRPEIAGPLSRILARHTTTADKCWFAVWHGRSDLDRAFHGRPTFELPARSYHLACGPITAAAQSVAAPGFRHLSPNLWWPDDQAWCVITEIDLDSTYLGASAACVEEIVAAPGLETARVSVSVGITADSDALNPTGTTDPPQQVWPRR